MTDEMNETETPEMAPEPLDPRDAYQWNMPNSVVVRAISTHETNEEGLPIWEFWIGRDMISIHIANAAVECTDKQFTEYSWLTYQEGIQPLFAILQGLDQMFAPQDDGCGCGDPNCGCGGNGGGHGHGHGHGNGGCGRGCGC